MSKIVAIDEIEDGMVLASPILNNFGQVLLPKDMELKQNHLRLLKTWNIMNIVVKSEGDQEENFEILPEIMEKAKEKIQNRLDWSPKNEIERNLISESVLLLAKKMQLMKNEQ